MNDWKTYTIESKSTHLGNLAFGIAAVSTSSIFPLGGSDFIRFHLDNSVRYKDGNENYIDCKNTLPFTE